MRKLICILLLSGCANVTTMKIRQAPDGTISIDSGKDVKADFLKFTKGNETVEVHGYSSMANTDAINAEANREVSVTNAVSDAVLKALQAGAGLASKAVVP